MHCQKLNAPSKTAVICLVETRLLTSREVHPLTLQNVLGHSSLARFLPLMIRVERGLEGATHGGHQIHYEGSVFRQPP